MTSWSPAGGRYAELWAAWESRTPTPGRVTHFIHRAQP